MVQTLTRLLAIGIVAAPLAAQAATFQFNASWNGAQQVPFSASSATGVATPSYNDNNKVVMGNDWYGFSLSAFGLIGVVTNQHIHAPGAAGVNAAPVVDLSSPPFLSFDFPAGAQLTGGAGAAPASTLFLSQRQSGLAYVNIHNLAHFGGQMRGQLFQAAVVPEPETCAMMMAGLGLIGWIGGAAAQIRRLMGVASVRLLRAAFAAVSLRAAFAAVSFSWPRIVLSHWSPHLWRTQTTVYRYGY